MSPIVTLQPNGLPFWSCFPEFVFSLVCFAQVDDAASNGPENCLEQSADCHPVGRQERLVHFPDSVSIGLPGR